ncbi:integrator complex assembly factor BRAT1 isoform X2 [Gouania willdenowi]|uniref:integrator complex assembly factor BRAT1 isoform X2 n=1 Tax=Gouania willdenowi TaxID=441366 RepID=UPI0010564480|nr:BRCA1-associated ATM activator 1 isoform X2 [Gouania willdenowi]
MEGECFTLLPRVCAVLAAGSSLPDDTSLEKLLDWFSELTTAGVSLVKDCPCLLEFTSTVVNSATSDPCILSFTLKLVGLLASSEDGFIVLQESSVLDLVFNPGHWEKAGHWEDPCVRIGWIQGLRSLLQHTKALCFFVQAGKQCKWRPHESEEHLQHGLIEPLLQLQTDTSLFVASAASQILAHILIFYQPSPSLTHNSMEKNEAADKSTNPSTTDDGRCPFKAETDQSFTTVVMLISEHLKNSLVSGGDAKLHHAQQSLRLLVLLLTRLRPPLRDSLLHAVTDALEELLMTDLTPPLMDVILAAHSSSSDVRIHRLVSSLLSTKKPTDLLHAAAAFLRRGLHDDVHTAQCARAILLPLHIVTGQLFLDMDPADEDLCSMAAQLQNKSSCISIICTCLTNSPLITVLDPSFLPCSLDVIISSILLMLRLCSGDTLSVSSGCSGAVRNVIGSSKVKKCALEALMSVSSSPGAKAEVIKVFTLLLKYLDDPDSDPTVFHKSYQVLVRWISVCRDPSSIPDQLKQDLLGVVRKRVCDVRWEVRDSTVEFLGRLAAVKVHHTTDTEAQSACEVLPGGSSSITPVLEEALLDPESYVRASAISALAQTQAPGWQQGAALTQERSEFVVRLLDVLSEDTEGFPRRAVVQYFISWFSSSASRSSLLRRSVRSVLSRGSADLDWEVKVHTLELAKLLLDEALSAHSSSTKELGAQCVHPYAVIPQPVYTPHTHTENGEEDTAALLETLVEEGVVSVLLSGLVDCDRPVALKACRLLIVLREALCPPSHTDLGTDRETVAKVSFLLPKSGWALEIIKILKTKNKAEEENAATLRSSNCIDELKLGEGYNKGWDGVSGAGCERMSVCELLSNLGLDERVKILNQSSDHVQNSPLSLLQDILSAGGAHTQPNTQLMQEVIVDCY